MYESYIEVKQSYKLLFIGVPIKKMSLIKRFKQIIEGDLSLFEEAVSTSPESFELNEAKTHLRCIKKVEEPKKEEEKDEKQSKNEEKIKNHIESLNHRSIYAVRKNMNSVKIEIKVYFCRKDSRWIKNQVKRI